MKTRLLCLILCSLVFPATAAAWGGNCSIANHCYGTLEQEVTGGTAAYVEVSSQGDNIPGWEAGAFVTNELWISFGSDESWIETGEISEGCCERKRFFAQQYPGSPFYMKIDPAEIILNETVIYGIAQCGGPWCIKWEGNVVHVFGGWPRTYSLREYGIEVVSESLPGSWGRARGIEGDGKAWGPQNFYVDNGLSVEYCNGQVTEGCSSTYIPSMYWGFGTGPHDRANATHSYKRHRHRRRFATVPVKRGNIPSHRRRTIIKQANGAIEVWVGHKPTTAEIRGEY